MIPLRTRLTHQHQSTDSKALFNRPRSYAPNPSALLTKNNNTLKDSNLTPYLTPRISEKENKPISATVVQEVSIQENPVNNETSNRVRTSVETVTRVISRCFSCLPFLFGRFTKHSPVVPLNTNAPLSTSPTPISCGQSTSPLPTTKSMLSSDSTKTTNTPIPDSEDISDIQLSFTNGRQRTSSPLPRKSALSPPVLFTLPPSIKEAEDEEREEALPFLTRHPLATISPSISSIKKPSTTKTPLQFSPISAKMQELIEKGDKVVSSSTNSPNDVQIKIIRKQFYNLKLIYEERSEQLQFMIEGSSEKLLLANDLKHLLSTLESYPKKIQNELTTTHLQSLNNRQKEIIDLEKEEALYSYDLKQEPQDSLEADISTYRLVESIQYREGRIEILLREIENLQKHSLPDLQTRLEELNQLKTNTLNQLSDLTIPRENRLIQGLYAKILEEESKLKTFEISQLKKILPKLETEMNQRKQQLNKHPLLKKDLDNLKENLFKKIRTQPPYYKENILLTAENSISLDNPKREHLLQAIEACLFPRRYPSLQKKVSDKDVFLCIHDALKTTNPQDGIDLVRLFIDDEDSD